MAKIASHAALRIRPARIAWAMGELPSNLSRGARCRIRHILMAGHAVGHLWVSMGCGTGSPAKACGDHSTLTETPGRSGERAHAPVREGMTSSAIIHRRSRIGMRVFQDGLRGRSSRARKGTEIRMTTDARITRSTHMVCSRNLKLATRNPALAMASGALKTRIRGLIG